MLVPVSVNAQPASAGRTLAVRLSFKMTGLVSRAPDAPWLFPARNASTGFWRARIEPDWRPNDRVTVNAAYEQRLQMFSSRQGTARVGVLGNTTAPAYRLTPLDWELAAGGHGVWRHEIDRASVHVKWSAADITAGRQAVGWGRGVLFSAVDVFAPFAPFEADREWRRGVDAIRTEVKLGDRMSAEAVGAFGRRPGESVYGARVRGYHARVDVEAMGGSRAGEPFAGVSSSFPIGGAELHGEAAVFRSVAKAVLGASYRLPVGSGVLVEGEYHYSGFGAASADRLAPLLNDPEFSRRYQRGDTQILGRHAFAVNAAYDWSPLVSSSVIWLQNPVDRSGLLLASATITPGDRGSLLVSAYLPFGKPPAPTGIRSEYGLMPLSLLLQFRFYR
jgi:hypothetical protein